MPLALYASYEYLQRHPARLCSAVQSNFPGEQKWASNDPISHSGVYRRGEPMTKDVSLSSCFSLVL